MPLSDIAKMSSGRTVNLRASMQKVRRRLETVFDNS